MIVHRFILCWVVDVVVVVTVVVVVVVVVVYKPFLELKPPNLQQISRN